MTSGGKSPEFDPKNSSNPYLTSKGCWSTGNSCEKSKDYPVCEAKMAEGRTYKTSQFSGFSLEPVPDGLDIYTPGWKAPKDGTLGVCRSEYKKDYGSYAAPYFAASPTNQTTSPFVKEDRTEKSINWLDMSPEKVREFAFDHHTEALKNALKQIDLEFVNEVKTLTKRTSPGVVYPIKDHSNLLPKIVQKELAPIIAMNPTAIDSLAFTWAWKGDRPELFVFKSKSSDGQIIDGFSIQDGMLAAGGLFAFGSMNVNPGGGSNLPVKPGLPVNSILIQGGIGAGIILGIHQGVLELGVPEKIAPYVDIPAMIGVFEAMNAGSAYLTKKGILSHALFPKGIQWGNVAQAAPMFVLGSYGTAYMLDAVGCEFGTACNSVGSVFLTMTGYVGLSQAAKLYSSLGTAYGTTIGAGLTPATINIGTRTLTLGVGTVGAGGGVYLAGGGIAGGAGWLAGGMQALGAIGAVALGSWAGDGIVDIYLWTSSKDEDRDFDLIDFTWDYMNHDSGGFIDAIFGPVIKGLQAVFIEDEIYDALKHYWIRWSGGANDWANQTDEHLLTVALAFTTGSDFASGKPKFDFNFGSFREKINEIYKDTAKPEDCNDKLVFIDEDGDMNVEESENACLNNAEAIKAVFDMIDRFKGSSKENKLNANTLALRDLIPGDNFNTFTAKAMKDHLHKVFNTLQKKGELKTIVRKMLRDVRKTYGKRMIDVGLAEYDETGTPKPIKIKPSELDDKQKAFLFGSTDTYETLLNKQLTDPSQIQSEFIALKNKMDALEYILKNITDKSDSKKPDMAGMIF